MPTSAHFADNDNQDHYALEIVYTGRYHTYTQEKIGTRYLFAAVRTLVDPADPQDVKQAQALQDVSANRNAHRTAERMNAMNLRWF
jgi:hypothetical protein